MNVTFLLLPFAFESEANSQTVLFKQPSSSACIDICAIDTRAINLTGGFFMLICTVSWDLKDSTDPSLSKDWFRGI